MDTKKKRIRREYAPLSLAVSVVCMTPGSLPTQVYNPENNQYEADRTLTPCVVAPIVIARAKDGSWKGVHANPLLAEMKWMLDGEDISTLPEWRDMYDVNMSDSIERGQLTIRKNIAPGTVHTLRFHAVIADTRTGMNIPVASEDVLLSTSDKSDDSYSLSIGDSQIIRYNPMIDRLSLYEYKVAQGLIPDLESERQAATDENSYLCIIPLSVHYGPRTLEGGYGVKLYRISSGFVLTELKAGGEVESITKNAVTLDLRLIEKGDYLIKVDVDGNIVAQEQFSVNRMYPKYNCAPTNGTSIASGDYERYDVAMADCDGRVVECPEHVLRIVWKTNTATKKGVVHNEGRETVFLLSSTGIGNDYPNDWIDVYTESSYKPPHSVATDTDGNVLTDEYGNTLIFN